MNEFIEKIRRVKTIYEATRILEHQIEITSNISKAIDFAIKAHDGQYRKSGEPYITHPILVAAITAAITENETMTIAALLHDVVEDTSYTLEDIKSNFGDKVALLVEGLTKIDEIRGDELPSSSSNEKLIKSAMTFRKMLLISIKDMSVLVIKLCDRAHNLMTLDSLPPNKQKRIAEESLVVYAPIAHRLGISKIKNLLEDLSFKYIYPKDFKFIDEYITSHKQSLNLRLNNAIDKIKTILNQNGFHRDSIEVIGRVKHYYSIYLKMHRKGVSIEEVLDLLAVRIIVKEPIECYDALGVLHLNYNPIISRFKDYVALPKDNGYQTIHTTLFLDEDIVEAQIRTQDMHKVAEYGVAAHWKYKNQTSSINLDWISNLPYQSESVESFYENAKADLFSEDIVVFSPKGDHYTLPKGSVALDFAYAVHSEVGDYATASLVNKEHTSLLKILKNGDIVKIITQDKPRLHCSWIDAVKTSKARIGIKSACNQRLKDINRQTALKILATIFNSDIEIIKKTIEQNDLENNLYKAATNLDTLKEKIHKIAQINQYREAIFWKLLKRAYRKPQIINMGFFTFYTNKIINGVDFDYCCHPKYGDEIVAFLEGDRVVIHHKLCSKASELLNSNTKMIFVQWRVKKSSKYRMIISLQNKKGALLELLKELDKLDLNITNIELGIKNSEKAEYCKIEVETASDNKNKIQDIISKKFKLIDFISLKDAYKK